MGTSGTGISSVSAEILFFSTLTTMDYITDLGGFWHQFLIFHVCTKESLRVIQCNFSQY